MTTKHWTLLDAPIRWSARSVRSLFAGLGPLAIAVLLAVPPTAAALFYVWTHVTTVRLGYLLSRAAENRDALVEENRALRIEISSLEAPERLARIATERFGLVPPRPDQIVRARREGAQ